MAETDPCPDCAAAQSKAHWPCYSSNCRGCRVRALANGPAYFEAACSQRITTAYRNALVTGMGAVDIAAAHEEVKTEHARIKALQSTAKGG